MQMSLSRAPLFACLLALVLAGVALADPPGATTGEATEVTQTTAVLGGVANPNKEETTVYFEYGTTPAYGARTPDEAIGGGNAGKDVSASISGLAPATTYHFRLVSRNPSGTDFGQDKTFTTLGGAGAPPPGAGVTIAASPTRVRFGRTTVVSGKVTGDKAAGAEVTLQHQPAPFSSPFANVATVAADATGAYSFTVGPTVNTRYQAVAKTPPPVTSPAVQVNVALAVGFRLSDSSVRSGRRVRFFGSVRPAHDGATARIQRRTSSGWRTVATTTLQKAATPDRSVYSKRLVMRRTARWRVRVAGDADHVTGTSRRRRVSVG